MKTTQSIWMDGKLVPWADAKVHVLTHSLHYGVAVFEGIRAYPQPDGSGAIFRLREHVKRLFESAHICLMEMPFTEEQVFTACREVLRANGMTEGYLRPIAYFSDGMMGVGAVNPVKLSIAAWFWGAYLGDEGLKKGIKVKISSYTRMHMNSDPTRAKVTGHYLNSVLAKREANMAGYDEAILLDQQGYVGEATGENLFLVRHGVLYTPPVAGGILEGITRESILRIAKDKGIPVEERRFSRDYLYVADEAFLCGTAAEITPVAEVDNRRIGQGGMGPITAEIQGTFFRAVRGQEPRYAEWLTKV
ncbi:MAG: branched-chain amino acid transaminase [Deltaproteobacteria bacterium]|nr:branched-chain amino acid transaminase [Deltaproteobacteria bacterium]